MILTGNQIIRAHSDGDLHIRPFDARQVNPNSYDYRLGADLIELSPAGPNTIRCGEHNGEPTPVAIRRSHQIGPQGFLLHPGHLYLGSTYESIGSETYVTTLIGKSSMGRLGLFLQVDACLGHQGIAHQWTLELCVRVPLRIYRGQIIGQVSFWDTLGERQPYTGRYGLFNRPMPNGSPIFLDSPAK